MMSDLRQKSVIPNYVWMFIMKRYRSFVLEQDELNAVLSMWRAWRLGHLLSLNHFVTVRHLKLTCDIKLSVIRLSSLLDKLDCYRGTGRSVDTRDLMAMFRVGLKEFFFDEPKPDLYDPELPWLVGWDKSWTKTLNHIYETERAES